MKKIIMIAKRMRLTAFLFVTLFTISACNKWVDVPPPTTSTSSENVYATESSASSVLTGIYTKISNYSAIDPSAPSSISFIGALSSDDLTLFNQGDVNLNGYYTNKLASNLQLPWGKWYNYIYTTNAAITGISSSPGISQPVKDQLIGQAKFIRAFCYFYLVNLYGDLPLALTTKFQELTAISRSSKDDVYRQIISDLNDAKVKLKSDYYATDAKSITSERTIPNKWAATALLARVQLYLKDYKNSIGNCTEVIESGQYSLVKPEQAFIKNSGEAIWQLQPVTESKSVSDARVFILPANGPNTFQNMAYLNFKLVGLFAPLDKRKAAWIGRVTANGHDYYFAQKYKLYPSTAAVSEYLMVIRFAELLLNRAEANAQLGRIADAVADLNRIRDRAGLSAYTYTDTQALLEEIYLQRRLEFFTEWGHRWLDLKRTDLLNSVMVNAAVDKGSSWSTTASLFPIPLYDLQADKNLVQNPGY